MTADNENPDLEAIAAELAADGEFTQAITDAPWDEMFRALPMQAPVAIRCDYFIALCRTFVPWFNTYYAESSSDMKHLLLFLNEFFDGFATQLRMYTGVPVEYITSGVSHWPCCDGDPAKHQEAA